MNPSVCWMNEWRQARFDAATEGKLELCTHTASRESNIRTPLIARKSVNIRINLWINYHWQQSRFACTYLHEFTWLLFNFNQLKSVANILFFSYWNDVGMFRFESIKITLEIDQTIRQIQRIGTRYKDKRTACAKFGNSWMHWEPH